MMNKTLKFEQDNRKVEANKKRKAAVFQGKQSRQRFKSTTQPNKRPVYLTPPCPRPATLVACP
ncbi:hypothetical protein E2562_014122 [Oryza meyeriana var. granulata]|uniref:Uncharacterized protein n=1 Tax=Oryza meyeriana var. granulata TaxID=110450 RepID=A0A6G1F8K1_9ORYZ|nr:hypothetical protein E2562_014122 [Oryza meyeriana var. granulata]